MPLRTPARAGCQGLAAAAAALLAMTGTAAVGLALLGAGRTGEFGGLTATVVAMAAGAPASFTAVPASELPIAVRGGVEAMPMGVSLAGAATLGWLLLRRGREWFLVRGAAAAAALTAGIAGASQLARGAMPIDPPDGGPAADVGPVAVDCASGMPPAGGGPAAAMGGGLDAEFSVASWSASGAAALWALAVVGVCFFAMRSRAALAGIRAVLWGLGGTAALGLVAAWVYGGAGPTGVLLLFAPLAVFAALLHGLGVPWTMVSDGPIACEMDASAFIGAPLTAVSGAVLLCCGVIVAARTGDRPGGMPRRAVSLAAGTGLTTGAALAAVAALSRVSIELGVQAAFFSRTLLEAELAADPLHALGAGLAGGAAAGLAGRLVVDLFRNRASLSWRAWSDRMGR